MSEDERMHVHQLSAWEDLDPLLAKIRESHKSCVPLLFRGQGNAEWALTTTLERSSLPAKDFASYYRTVYEVKAEIESLNELKWETPDLDEMRRRMQLINDEFIFTPDVCEYLLYLRHHDFPSPLLDWTRSPYVASYFAFRVLPPETNGQVAVYVFDEMPGESKSSAFDSPRIIRIGHRSRSHKRHVLQQSDYSCCVVNQDYTFTPHDKVFANNSESQDVLIKITIPATERLKVLKSLDEHNLNAFSLFGSEERLMETLAIREEFRSQNN